MKIDIAFQKKIVTADEDSIEAIEKTQTSAMEIIKEHLAGPLRDLEKQQKYKVREVAAALIMLAYHTLRHNRSTKSADDAFDILAHFCKHRVEKTRWAALKRKLN